MVAPMHLNNEIQSSDFGRMSYKAQTMGKSVESYWNLHNHKIFDLLSPEELKELGVLVGFIKAPKKQVVNLLKDNVERIYFLKEGQLKISRYEGKEEITVDILNKGDVFGQIYTQNFSSKRKETVKVISEEAVICTFTKENFEKLLNKNPSLCLKYSKKLGDRMISLEQRYSNLIFKDVKTRLYEFLIELSKLNGIQSEKGITVKTILTHQDIADLIGSKRQTISTLLSELKLEKLIDYNRDEILILS